MTFEGAWVWHPLQKRCEKEGYGGSLPVVDRSTVVSMVNNGDTSTLVDTGDNILFNSRLL
uniref:Uncharacterized protein n=1 Tax=Romanomermis culicivorax TaxID=13658 RepID=A0A915HS84_ROMCU